MFDKNSSQNSKRHRQFQELDERLQRWQREHPAQAWAVTFCISAAFVGLLWLFGGWRSAMDDCVVKMLLELGSPLTQEGYLRLAYWDNRKIEDLGPEELAELPEGFEEWPRTEKDIH